MTYQELTAKLVEIEKATGVYLSDTCVDAENAGRNATDAQLFHAAADAAGIRAEEAGLDINALVGKVIY
jgi:hypothetical protein